MTNKLKFIKRIFKITELLFFSQKKIYCLCLIISILTGILPVISAYVWKLLLDAIQYTPVDERILKVTIFLVLLGGVKLSSGLLSDLNNDLKNLQADYFNIYITDKLLSIINKTELSNFDDSDYYNNYDMVCNQSLQKTFEIGSALSNIIISMISIAASFVVLSRLKPILMILILVIGMPSLFAQTAISKKMFKVFESRIEKLRYTQFLKSFMIQYNNIKEIKILSAGDYFKRQIIDLYVTYVKENKKLIKEFTVKRFAVNIIQMIVSVFIQILMTLNIIIRNNSIGDAMFYLQTYINAETSIGKIFYDISKIYESDLYIEKLLEFLNGDNISGRGKEELDEEFKSITFKNVSFTYPKGKEPVLKNINLTIEKGKKYAIVGKNGSGKSTFIKLLLNLYSNYDGAIFFNNIDLNEFNIKNYTGKFGVIFQDFTRYPLSVRDNIAIGNYKEIDNIKMVKEIAVLCGANDFIEKLSQNYDTNLFKQWSSGTDLSLGQWQRIGFARAVFRRGDLLIMDEPTSALDAFAEKEIVEMAEQYCISHNRTSVLISHRLSNVKNVDEILVFDNGEIVEKGTHRELIEKKGLYYNLFTTQADSYNSTN